jgi:Xaa-Pro aminopeptidase
MSQTVPADRVRMRPMPNPAIATPREYPTLTRDVYGSRLKRLQQRMAAERLDALVVYADREHFANFAWLTGVDPRFEEAIAVVRPDGVPTVLLGNECLSLAEWSPAAVKPVHWPSLSLISQPRHAIRPLKDLLREAGIAEGGTVGLAGWKYYGASEFDEPEHAFETPSYLVEALREVAGGRDRVLNATALFMSPESGLRTENEPAHIAQLEFAASLVSDGIADLLSRLEPGKTEMELAERLNSRGLPLSCHPMVSSGKKARYGLTSPSSNVVRRGDAFTTAFGVCGALTCRAGYVAACPADLPAEYPN